MATKLKLPWQDRQLAWAFSPHALVRAVIFSLVLALAAATGFSLLATTGFFLVAGLVYLVPLFRTLSHPISFATLAILAVALGAQLVGIGELFPFIVAIGILAYLILALKDLHFVGRANWHYLTTFGLWYLLALTFFSGDHTSAFTYQLLATSIASFLLWREFFVVSPTLEGANATTPLQNALKPLLAAGITSIVASQFLWVTSTLPLGMINSTNLVALAIFSVTDLLRQYSANTLSVRSALWHFTVAVSLTIAIFFIAAFS